jgi:hypothetical protein
MEWRAKRRLRGPRLLFVGAAVALCSASLGAQIVDQIVVTSDEVGVPGPVIRRFDRRLNLLGSARLR